MKGKSQQITDEKDFKEVERISMVRETKDKRGSVTTVVMVP